MTVYVIIRVFGSRFVSIVGGGYDKCSDDYMVVIFGPRRILVVSHHLLKYITVTHTTI